jgi:HEAT repeat protein
MAKSDADQEVRIRAMRALVKINSTNAHNVLIELHKTESEEQVKDTISSLIRRCLESAQESPAPTGPPSQSTISELNSPDHRIRRRAARSLGKSKHESAVAPLCAVLKDENENVRTTAAEALRGIGSDESLIPLIEVLENDPYNHARAAAARSLGAFGDKRAVDALRNGLSDRSGLVRKWCVRSLDDLRVGQLVDD